MPSDLYPEGEYIAETIQIVGMARSTRDQHLDEHPVWALNESPQFGYLKRVDALFQIHEEEDFSRMNNPNQKNHYAWLQNAEAECLFCEGTGKWEDPETGVRSKVKKCKKCVGGIYTPDRDTSYPIFMQKAFENIPGAFEYPLDEMVEFYPFVERGPEKIKKRYFGNSLSYALALAGYIPEIKNVLLWGFEAASNTEWANQKPSIEYWGARIMGKTETQLWVPEGCRLFNFPLYGYEVGMYISRQELERYNNGYSAQLEEAKTEIAKLAGQIELTNNMLRAAQHPQQKTKLSNDLRKLQQKHWEASARGQNIHGVKIFSEFLEQKTTRLSQISSTI
jgi:hypothetical protein